MSERRSFVFRPRVTPLGVVPDAGELLARLEGHRSRAALDSAGGAPRRWSVVAFDPIEGAPPPASISSLRAYVASLERADGDDVPGPFHGGFVGALAYDLGVAGEHALDLPRDPWGSPLVAGGLHVDYVVRDEASGEGWLVLGDEPGDRRAPLVERRARLLAELARPAEARVARATARLERKTSRAEHAARIERLRESIAAGDLYQANLAHRFECAVEGRPVDLYRALRAANPGPYMGFLEWDAASCARPALVESGGLARGALLSASPELLLEVHRERGVRVARTRPIKGTAPRGRTSAEDASLARALLASEKDRAELAMIVDLERNDLGRVARVGTVVVERFPSLESYASVHHLVADVVAELREDRDALDALEALFPGGSITGAPKVASMRRIAELEREGRGFFTGTLGFADLRGDAAFNVLIRTLVWRPRTEHVGEVAFHVGGGITWSSDAAAEDRETLAKGEALARALGADRLDRSE